MKLRTLILGVALVLIVTTRASFGYVLGPTYDPPDSPGKWGAGPAGTGATITWSIMGGGLNVDGGPDSVALGSIMPFDFTAEIQAAFAAWAAIANLTFVQVTPDCGSGWTDCGTANIRIGAHNLGSPGLLAHGYYPPDNGGFRAGDIHFNSNTTWEVASDGTGDGAFSVFQVMVHEIGHAIGLDHTTNSSALMYALYQEIGGPQADDIAGAQFLYGAPIAVPIPAALPLFATALLLMGMTGWRSRRRAAA